MNCHVRNTPCCAGTPKPDIKHTPHPSLVLKTRPWEKMSRVPANVCGAWHQRALVWRKWSRHAAYQRCNENYSAGAVKASVNLCIGKRTSQLFLISEVWGPSQSFRESRLDTLMKSWSLCCYLYLCDMMHCLLDKNKIN